MRPNCAKTAIAARRSPWLSLRHGEDRPRSFAVCSRWRSQPDDRHWPDQALRADQSRRPGDGKGRPGDAGNDAQPSPTYRALNYLSERLPLLAPNRTAAWVFKCQTRERPGLGGLPTVCFQAPSFGKRSFADARMAGCFAPNNGRSKRDRTHPKPEGCSNND